jgi:hypothetical protein
MKPFDYASCAFGIGASLAVLLLSGIPGVVLFMIEAIAAVICLLFLSMFVGSVFAGHLGHSEQRICLYHVACNFIPTLHLLSRLKETPWNHFVA